MDDFAIHFYSCGAILSAISQDSGVARREKGPEV